MILSKTFHMLVYFELLSNCLSFHLFTAKSRVHFTLHVLGDLMAAVAGDQVTKTKLILYQSIADVVQLTLSIFPVFIHHPGKK